MKNEGRSVGPEHFDDGDRIKAVEAGVALVNALVPYDINLDGIGVSEVCHNCTPVTYSYVIELGRLHPEDAEAIAAKLRDHTEEFQRLHDLTAKVQVDAEMKP